MKPRTGFPWPTGTIICHGHRWDGIQRERLRYEWEGGDIVGITPEIIEGLNLEDLEEGDMFKIGPFRLICMGLGTQPVRIVALRYRGPWSRLAYWWYRSMPIFALIKHRFLLTLAVWELARFPRDGEIVTWSNIHLIRRGRNFLRRLHAEANHD